MKFFEKVLMGSSLNRIKRKTVAKLRFYLHRYGHFLFFKAVRTITAIINSVTFYLAKESEPSLLSSFNDVFYYCTILVLNSQ